jgi:phosphoglycolate phosphatase-like HAD superfamily hydrolase
MNLNSELPPNRLLILIDIDGTLISPGQSPRRCLARAIFEATGRQLHFEVGQLAGFTDPSIVRTALERLGYVPDERDGQVPKILDRYLDLLEEEYPHNRDQILYPGVLSLLDYLQSKNYRLGLITGNLNRGARIKLAVFDLNRYFPFGAFGDDSADRDQLPQIALQRVQQLFGESYLPAQVVIIGDTVRDVWSAHRNGMPAIAVIRHENRRDEIIAEAPELILSGFEDLDPICEFLNNLRN